MRGTVVQIVCSTTEVLLGLEKSVSRQSHNNSSVKFYLKGEEKETCKTVLFSKGVKSTELFKILAEFENNL